MRPPHVVPAVTAALAVLAALAEQALAVAAVARLTSRPNTTLTVKSLSVTMPTEGRDGSKRTRKAAAISAHWPLAAITSMARYGMRKYLTN